LKTATKIGSLRQLNGVKLYNWKIMRYVRIFLKFSLTLKKMEKYKVRIVRIDRPSNNSILVLRKLTIDYLILLRQMKRWRLSYFHANHNSVNRMRNCSKSRRKLRRKTFKTMNYRAIFIKLNLRHLPRSSNCNKKSWFKRNQW
jgi:hypothetical protein